jgi:uncharacterized protein YbjT (DUF2867 family)
VRVLVVGSTGRVGRAVVAQLLEAGHEVTAFSRRGTRSVRSSRRLRAFAGDARSLADVENAMRGHGAVVVTLGISENPWLLRLFGPRHTAPDVRSWGTRNVIFAMHRLGLRRLVVLTRSGLGRDSDLAERVVFELLSGPEQRDVEQQTREVIESGLDWVIVRSGRLGDGADDARPVALPDGVTGRVRLSFSSVARFMAEAVTSPRFVGRALTLSGEPATIEQGSWSGALTA